MEYQFVFNKKMAPFIPFKIKTVRRNSIRRKPVRREHAKDYRYEMGEAKMENFRLEILRD